MLIAAPLQILIDFLIEVEHLDEAAILLTKCLNDEDFVSKKGHSKHQVGNLIFWKLIGAIFKIFELFSNDFMLDNSPFQRI